MQPTMITRITAIEILKKYIWKSLAVYADDFWIQRFVNGKQNKWWKWLVIERLIGLNNNCSRAPNGLWFELKSVSFINKNWILIPKETMAITMINPNELMVESFYESHCWNKLKQLVFCAVEWTWHNQEDAILQWVTSFDMQSDLDLVKNIEFDYKTIQQKLLTFWWWWLTWSDGIWMQARTKWSWHGSTSRAFYAKKNLVTKIFEWSVIIWSGRKFAQLNDVYRISDKHKNTQIIYNP